MIKTCLLIHCNLKGGGHGHFHNVLYVGDAETQNSIYKILECIKVVKYAVKIVQNTAGMYIVMVSSVCGIAHINVTSDTHKGIQEVFTLKTSL